MSVQPEQVLQEATAPPNFNGANEIHYPETDGQEMGETAIHYKLIHYLFGCLQNYLAARSDVFIAANLMLYYEEGNPRKYYVPDLMIVFGADNRNRSSYKLWEEGQFPQIVVEVASESTYETDLGKKRRDYEQFGVEEYYLLDPENEYLPAPIMFFRRETNRLRLVSINEERVFSPLLNLEFVNTNDGIRLFNRSTDQFLRSLQEAELENERLRQELERLKQSN